MAHAADGAVGGLLDLPVLVNVLAQMKFERPAQDCPAVTGLEYVKDVAFHVRWRLPDAKGANT
ncbi:hypothetical protein Q9G87_33630 [Nonomuraea sp. G32]|nr:hypothetical protein [Nonomuraea sp. G32]MDP4506955.1 hypothetical protein [Nonomuraea sp. G32]